MKKTIRKPPAKKRVKTKRVQPFAQLDAERRVRQRAKKSTALVKVETAMTPPIVDAQLVTTGANERQIIDGGIRLDVLGLVELKATPEEEKVLAREPEPIDVSILPTGVPYLSHPVYTKRLNEAFGRGGWTLVPVSKPAIIESVVTCKYILYVHGKPVALADGEQQYHANNRDQSYGDALESTYASALRRCCKHLGIALELWDRRWSMHWRTQHAVAVTVKQNRKQADNTWKEVNSTQWRRKDDPPLKGEVGVGRPPREEKPENQEEHADMDKPISPEKRERLWRIASRVGRNEADIKAWLLACYKVKSSTEITNRNYDKIVRTLEGSGPLPTCTDKPREPGQEG